MPYYKLSAANTHILSFILTAAASSCSQWSGTNKQKNLPLKSKTKRTASFPTSPVAPSQPLAGAGNLVFKFKGLFLNVVLFENLITSHLDV